MRHRRGRLALRGRLGRLGEVAQMRGREVAAWPAGLSTNPRTCAGVAVDRVLFFVRLLRRWTRRLPRLWRGGSGGRRRRRRRGRLTGWVEMPRRAPPGRGRRHRRGEDAWTGPVGCLLFFSGTGCPWYPCACVVRVGKSCESVRLDLLLGCSRRQEARRPRREQPRRERRHQARTPAQGRQWRGASPVLGRGCGVSYGWCFQDEDERALHLIPDCPESSHHAPPPCSS